MPVLSTIKGHKRAALAVLISIVVFTVLVDRVAWASVASWREDGAANIWLGYTRSSLQVPVGLISSTRVPNPNGLVLASILLSRLPNLWVIGTVLGLLQAVLLGWMSWLTTRDMKLVAIVAGPLLSSITLRGASVDLWGQWMLIPVNCMFIAGLLLYLRRSTLWALPVVVLASLLAPSVYFSGIVNAVVFVLLTIAVGYVQRPRFRGRHWVAPLLTSAGIVALSLWLTWLPFFREVGITDLSRALAVWPRTSAQRLLAAAGSVIRFAALSLDQFATLHLYRVGQVESHILSPAVWSGYRLLLWQSWLQGIICYASILLGCVSLAVKRQSLANLVAPANRLSAVAVLLMTITVLACYVIAPLTGGPAWGEGERLDQVTQFLPFVLVLWFLTPALLEHPGWSQPFLRRLTWISAFVYTIVSLSLGLLVVAENLRYRGPKLTDADVPLIDKLRLVNFAARDWKARSLSPEIPMDYDLGGGRWDWITDFGAAYLEWYPAPYTIGRAFDYELLRTYQLRNAQEGIQQRSFGSSRYLVTYSFRAAPRLTGTLRRDYEFGRLRLTIRDDPPLP